MSSTWPLDPDTRDYVARLLWQALPTYYRVEDQPPRGEGQLQDFLRVLAAPLALARHGIEEHAANLFIDTCSDEALVLLAELVGTSLVFPDADSNRRDIRGTVAWRRRKGTAPMLADMGRELADRLVVMQEGWKLLAVTQDLDVPRRERVVPNLRAAIAADISAGPRDRMHHLAGGRCWPGRITHWVHETTTWPVHEGAAAYLGRLDDPRTSVTAIDFDEVADDDWRYAVDPLGAVAQLRARIDGERDELRSDRITNQHFAAAPEQCFGRPGRFTVYLNSLPAAITEPKRPSRVPSAIPASAELIEGASSTRAYLIRLDEPRERWWTNISVRVYTVPLLDGVPQTADISMQAAFPLGDGSFTALPSSVNGDEVIDLSNSILALRLVPQGGPAFCPGAVVELSGAPARAKLAAEDPGLASEGYLRGALVIELPECWLSTSRWFYIAADGSLVNAQHDGVGKVDVPLLDVDGAWRLDLGQLVTQSHGSAWPPLATSRHGGRIDRIPPARGRGPTILHGGYVFEPAQLEIVGDTVESALVFAAESMDAGEPTYEPLVRLRWTGHRATPIATQDYYDYYHHGYRDADPTWEVLDDRAVAIVGAEAIDTRYADLSAWRQRGPTRLRLVVRFESALAGARLSPAEVAYTSFDGRTTLIHLPELVAASQDTSTTWASVDHGNVSELIEPAEDGSCWGSTGGLRRVSNGNVAPLPVARSHRRRQVQWRNLRPWLRETPSERHTGTKPGKLDLDVELGFFALSIEEFPVPWTPGPWGAQPPNVTVDYEDAGTAAIGARTTNRELEPTPTRIVCGSGARLGDRAQRLHDVPHYSSLTEALAAVSEPVEVVQFEDSSTYRGEHPLWPQPCESLTIQAAEGYRPIIEFDGFDGAEAVLAYARLSLRGLAWRGTPGGDFDALELPHTQALELAGCTMLEGNERLVLDLRTAERALLRDSMLATIEAGGGGQLRVERCAIDSGYAAGNVAITATELVVERATIIGAVVCTQIDASESLFVDDVTVADRYRGCVRYCAVTSNSVLPRHHRTIVDPQVHFVSTVRRDPAYLRLEPTTDASVRAGAEDGSELGVYHDLHSGRRLEALARRLQEATPAGLETRLLTID